MAMFRYAVLWMHSEWKIVCARRRMGHFATSDAAVVAARKLAHTAVEGGHQAELLMQGPTGELSPLAFTHLALQDFDTTGVPDRGWPDVKGLTPAPTAEPESLAKVSTP
jgi:hypothetical protein